eukprot:765112-Hanusia_phi.AAC.8
MQSEFGKGACRIIDEGEEYVHKVREERQQQRVRSKWRSNMEKRTERRRRGGGDGGAIHLRYGVKAPRRRRGLKERIASENVEIEINHSATTSCFLSSPLLPSFSSSTLARLAKLNLGLLDRDVSEPESAHATHSMKASSDRLSTSCSQGDPGVRRHPAPSDPRLTWQCSAALSRRTEQVKLRGGALAGGASNQTVYRKLSSKLTLRAHGSTVQPE